MKFKTFSEIIERFKTFACHDIGTRVMINLDGLLFEVESISNGFYPKSPITINGKIKSGRADHRRHRNMSFRLKRVFHLFQLIPLALHKKGDGYQSDDTDQVGECQSSQHISKAKRRLVLEQFLKINTPGKKVEIPLLDDQFESESFQLIRGIVQEEIEIARKEKRL